MCTVLVIDDDQSMLSLSGEILQSCGYKVRTARFGKEALDLLSGLEIPKLILLDFRLKDMNGYEFMEHFQNMFPELFTKIPVIFHSGMDHLPLGKAKGFLRKASGIDEFLITIGKHTLCSTIKSTSFSYKHYKQTLQSRQPE